MEWCIFWWKGKRFQFYLSWLSSRNRGSFLQKEYIHHSLPPAFCLQDSLTERSYPFLLYRHECFTGNRPLVKFIRNYIRDSSGVFSISSLVRISLTSFPAFAWLFVQSCQTPVEKCRAIDSWNSLKPTWNRSLRSRRMLTRRRKLHMT